MKDICIKGIINDSAIKMIEYAKEKGITFCSELEECCYTINLYPDVYYHEFILHYAYISLEFKFKKYSSYVYNKVVCWNGDYFYIGKECYYFKLVRSKFAGDGPYIDYDILVGATREQFQESVEDILPPDEMLELYKKNLRIQ